MGSDLPPRLCRCSLLKQGHQTEKLTQYFEHYLVSGYALHSVEKGTEIIQISY